MEVVTTFFLSFAKLIFKNLKTAKIDNGGGSGVVVMVALVVVLLVACGVGCACVCITKRPAGLYTKLSALVPGRAGGAGDQRYRKLNFDTTKDTTSFFDDDDLANREQQ